MNELFARLTNATGSASATERLRSARDVRNDQGQVGGREVADSSIADERVTVSVLEVAGRDRVAGGTVGRSAVVARINLGQRERPRHTGVNQPVSQAGIHGRAVNAAATERGSRAATG